MHPVELLIQQGRCRLKGFDANSCHIRLSSQHIKFVVLLAKDLAALGFLHAPEDALVLGAQLCKVSESESSHPAVVLYMLKQVSVNRFNELKEDIEKLINDYSKYPKIAEILRDVSGLTIILYFIDIIYLCGRKSAGIDFTLNANTIKREKEVVHSLHDLASLYTASVLCQIVAEKFGKVGGG